MSDCEFFHYIGSPVCDNCGKPAKDHKGMRVSKRGSGPFSGDWEDLTWPQLRERADLEHRLEEAKDYLDTLPPEELIALADRLRSKSVVSV